MSEVEYLETRSAGDPAQPGHPDYPEQVGEVLASSPRTDRLRPRMGPRSLTFKLVAGVVSLVVVLVLLIGGGTYFALRSFLVGQLDQQLQTAVGTATTQQAVMGNNQGGLAPVPVYVVLLRTGAASLEPRAGANGLKPMLVSAADRTRLLGLTTSNPLTILTSDGNQLRVTVRQIPRSNPEAVLVFGLSMNDESDTLHRLFLLEVLIGGAALVLALLATTYGVQFGLRRLRRVTVTAQEVAAELSPEGAGLDRRVPDDEPETEVGQLAISFNTMLAAVQTQFVARVESEQRMRQFLADASHELRTPLTSIRGFAELARMQRAAGDYAEDNLDRIESEGTRMSRLVEDLLTLARSDAADDAQSIQREPIEIGELLDDAASSARAAFADRQIDVQVVPTPAVLGDRDQLLRVVRNLVTNACVHTRPDAPILLRCYVDGPGVAVQVVDGGPGLPAEDAAHVFERFWRADKARTRARGGTGLGMSIVATIVRTHGGGVRFDSTVESGSTVTVWLPSSDPDAGRLD